MKEGEEAVVDPSLPIIDPHHHLFDRSGARYLLDDLLSDLGSGHDVQRTVFIECGTMYRAECPEALRPVGETEFANGVAAMSASGVYGKPRACAGIVGFADLRLGEEARPVLDALVHAGGGRFRGVRHLSTWDADESLYRYVSRRYPRGLLLDPAFRLGFAQLAPLGLSFDALLYFHQLDDLASLARAFPETTIVLNHLGFPVGVGPYSGRRNEVFDAWKRLLRKVAIEPNVVVKLGGLGMPLFGFDFHTRKRPAGSGEIAHAWRPYIETCIELFGTSRCMFESNFPMDRPTCSYTVLWNAFKRIAESFTPMEKADLFNSTAARIYRLELARSEVLSSTFS